MLDVDGQAPPPELSGWKDTIQLPPRRLARVIMRFDDYADPDSPYMYHCHPGEAAGELPAHGQPGHELAEDHG